MLQFCFYIVEDAQVSTRFYTESDVQDKTLQGNSNMLIAKPTKDIHEKRLFLKCFDLLICLCI